jgi:hypothetical protein
VAAGLVGAALLATVEHLQRYLLEDLAGYTAPRTTVGIGSPPAQTPLLGQAATAPVGRPHSSSNGATLERAYGP